MQITGFKQEKVLGEGSYGKVYKTRRLVDNQIYALKVVDLNKLSFREIQDAVNEIRLMASITSPFIISFYEALAAEDSKRLCIVTEYAKLGDLSHLIERRKLRNSPLQEGQVWQYLLEILEGLRILHSCGVVHRDLKSANILLSAPDLVKIGDLGIATVLHHKKSTFEKEMAKTQIGTPLYLAPEIWQNRPYDQKCDMWSLGVLLYEMLTFTFPFIGRTRGELQRRICVGYYELPKSTEKIYSRELISIMKRLLNVNPNERPSVDDLLNTQSVKEHMDLLNPFIQTDLMRCSSLNDIMFDCGRAKLLQTIRVPYARQDRYGRRKLGLDDIQLPSEKYNRRQPKVVPIGERLQMKKEAPISSSIDFATLSTPDLTLITDHDWWAPSNSIKPSYTQLEIDQNLTNNENSIKNSNSLENEKFYNQNQINFNVNNRNSNDDIKPSPRRQQLKNVDVDVDENKIHVVQPPKVSPLLIPPRYRYLFKPVQNKLYQDPRWRRKQPSIRIQQKPVFNNHVNYNNIFSKQQQDVPWWFGQELQKQPVQPQQRRPPMVAGNVRFKRF